MERAMRSRRSSRKSNQEQNEEEREEEKGFPCSLSMVSFTSIYLLNS